MVESQRLIEALEGLLQRLQLLLAEERRCLIEWRSADLLTVVARKRETQDQFLEVWARVAVSDSRAAVVGAAGEGLRRLARETQAKGRQNEGLVRTSLRMIDGMAQVLQRAFPGGEAYDRSGIPVRLPTASVVREMV
jgi:hypothetical protein